MFGFLSGVGWEPSLRKETANLPLVKYIERSDRREWSGRAERAQGPRPKAKGGEQSIQLNRK